MTTMVTDTVLNLHSPVAVAMSGGVDSSVVAALLKKEGHAVHGFFLRLAQPDLEAQEDRVRAVAAFLDIPFTSIDLGQEFDKVVLDYFCQTYFRGKTPNPCMICNARIKFGAMLRLVQERGFACLATGHYVRIAHDPKAGFCIMKGRDPKKDQSYFLSQLGQDHLAMLSFPLGERTKDEVRLIARELGLASRHGAESQDVCFLKGRELRPFLEQRLPGGALVGPVMTAAGETIGQHPGIHTFTIGQRRGLGLPDVTPYYVLALSAEGNRVVVGKKDDLWREEVRVRRVNWVSGEPPALPRRLAVRLRYRHKEADALVSPGPDEVLTVRFAAPQRAITPGQFAVFYQGEVMLGGGEICAPAAD